MVTQLVNGATRRTSPWLGLAAAIAGDLVLPGDRDYDRVRTPAIARFTAIRPQAVVRCRDPHDVAEALAFARRAELPVAVRSGGHDFAGRSSTRGLVVDLAPLASVSVRDGLVRVGAGTRLGALYPRLTEHGLTLPAGCGATVGISGLTLGGGLGLLGRRHGLTCDRLRRAEVVLADGQTVECDEGRHPELFWALRGAGAAGLGVVTALDFQPVAEPVMTRFRVTWPLACAPSAVAAWQRWAPDAPRAVSAELSLVAGTDDHGEGHVILAGAVIDAEADVHAELAALVDRIAWSPKAAELGSGPYSAVKREPAPSDASDDDAHAISRSECFAQLLPPAAIARLVEELAHAPAAASARRIEFLPLGGAYADLSSDATAFAHRDQRFLIKHSAVVPPDTASGQRTAAERWLARSSATTRPWGSGRVYPNFPERGLTQPSRAHYAQHLPRLRRVRAHYDPDQMLGPKHTGVAGRSTRET